MKTFNNVIIGWLSILGLFVRIDAVKGIYIQIRHLDNILMHAIDRGHELLIGNNFASIKIRAERVRCPLCFKLSLLVPHSIGAKLTGSGYYSAAIVENCRRSRCPLEWQVADNCAT